MKKLFSAAIGAVLLVSWTAGASAQLGSSADGQNRWVKVNNNSSYVITHVFAVPTRWGARVVNSGDFIPGRVISPNQFDNVDFDRGDRECLLDIRAIDSRGGEWVFRAFNVCRGSQLNLWN